LNKFLSNEINREQFASKTRQTKTFSEREEKFAHFFNVVVDVAVANDVVYVANVVV